MRTSASYTHNACACLPRLYEFRPPGPRVPTSICLCLCLCHWLHWLILIRVAIAGAHCGSGAQGELERHALEHLPCHPRQYGYQEEGDLWCVHVVCVCGVCMWCVHVVCACLLVCLCACGVCLCACGVCMWCVHVVCVRACARACCSMQVRMAWSRYLATW